MSRRISAATTAFGCAVIAVATPIASARPSDPGVVSYAVLGKGSVGNIVGGPMRDESLFTQPLQGFFVDNPVLLGRGAERMDVKADIFPVATVLVLLQDPDLVEGASEVGAAKWFVLIKFQTVLIVQVERPKFVKRHGKGDLICWVQTRENAVSRFD